MPETKRRGAPRFNRNARLEVPNVQVRLNLTVEPSVMRVLCEQKGLELSVDNLKVVLYEVVDQLLENLKTGPQTP